MQTRTITCSKLQKFKEFGQGLNKVGKHCFAFQHSKRYSEAWNKAQTSSSFGCQEPGSLSICCSSQGIGFMADIDHFIDKPPLKWAVPFWTYSSLSPPCYLLLLTLGSTAINSDLLKTHFPWHMQVLIMSVCNWEKVTDKHSQNGLKTIKLHLEWVLSQVNGWRENIQHLHRSNLNKLGAKQDSGGFLESSGSVNLNILYVTLWQTC